MTELTDRAIPAARHALDDGRVRHWLRGIWRAERAVPDDRVVRLRLLGGTAIGVAFLFVAHWLAPQQFSLLAAPSGVVGWLAMICGIIGLWLVPGLWLSSVIMRVGVGPVAWLATRIATTLAWYTVVGPVIHHAGHDASVTTVGILTVTTAATAAVCLGVAFGVSRWPASYWLQILVAACAGGICAQAAISVSSLMWRDDRAYTHAALDIVIVVGSALLAVLGTVNRPILPPVLTVRSMRTPLIALGVIAVTAAVIPVVSAKWSPAQKMPSAYGAEQIPAPEGADLAFALTAFGPDGAALIPRADFTASDVAGRAVPIQTRLVGADGTADRASLLVVLPRNMQQELCGKELLDKAIMTGAPIKLTVRDKTSGLMLQAPIPVGWCAG